MGGEPGSSAAGERFVVVGRVRGVHGLRGWLRVESYTRPAENLLNYNPWHVRDGGAWRPLEFVSGRPAARGFLVHLRTVDDRDAARALIGADVAVRRSQLPPAEAGSWYWCDLVGMEVVRTTGETLGRVAALQETGAHDVLVIEGAARQLVPFVTGPIVKTVDPQEGRIVVDWDPEPL